MIGESLPTLFEFILQPKIFVDHIDFLRLIGICNRTTFIIN